MGKTLKTAIIGAGRIGTLHAEVCSKFKEVDIVGIIDIEEAKARSLANKYNTKFFIDLNTLIKNNDLDIAAICTPTPEFVS